jgi:hypothetical protein
MPMNDPNEEPHDHTDEQADDSSTWSLGTMHRRREPQAPPMPMPWEWPSQCEASLSAESYKRHTPKADYDHDRWLWLDGGHERCTHSVAKLMPTLERWYGFCKRHDSGPGGQFFPYLEPGAGCDEPCCNEAGDRVAPVAQKEGGSE